MAGRMPEPTRMRVKEQQQAGNMPLETYGNYEVVNELGAGGAARVFLAQKIGMPEFRAVLKVVYNPRFVERFRDEARKLALLEGHRNICHIKDYFVQEGKSVIVMEYVRGFTLADAMDAWGGRMPPNELSRFLPNFLDALEYAHRKHIWHRDIKPTNVMLERETGEVKIIDFGIAKAKDDPLITSHGSVIGTPAYMAPEQMKPTKSSQETDFALCDVYASGITMYHVLCGRLPFAGRDLEEIYRSKTTSKPMPPGNIVEDLPELMGTVIMKAIASRPEDRYQTVREMREALESNQPPRNQAAETVALTQFVEKTTIILENEGRLPKEAGLPPAAEPTALAETGDKKKKRTPLYAAAALLVLMIVAGIVWYDDLRDMVSSAVPDPPQLYAPAPGSTFEETDPVKFAWSATAGSDGYYEFNYASDARFSDAIRRDSIFDTTYVLRDRPGTGQYYWRIFARQVDGSSSVQSPTRIFSLVGPPSPPRLIGPENKARLFAGSAPTFVWSSPMGFHGEYQLEYSRDPSFRDARRVDDIADTFYTPSSALAAGDYHWRLRAVDSDGRESEFTEAGFAVVTRQTPRGRIDVAIEGGGDVYFDGALKASDVTEWSTTADEGQHRLEVRNENSIESRLSETVTVRSGQPVSRTLAFSFPEKGKLIVVSSPSGAQIFVDGVYQSEIRTPHTLTLTAGQHVIKVVGSGNRDLESQVNVLANEQRRVIFNFDNDKVTFGT